MSEAVAIIPARFASTRLPGKVLADIGGRPLIQHVYERVSRASSLSAVVVATDDERVFAAVEAFGGRAVMTSPDHVSGTDRVAEAAHLTGGDIIVNVQGDEPLIDPALIDRVVEKLADDDHIEMATATWWCDDEVLYRDPNAVKVVLDDRERALWFSRSPLPYYRDGIFGGAYIHIGIYGFRRRFLEWYHALTVSPCETAEKLEQLRVLEHGYQIGVVTADRPTRGVDTQADLDEVRRLLAGA